MPRAFDVISVAYAVASFFLAILLWRALLARRSLQWLRSQDHPASNTTGCVIVLIPVFRELENIDNLFRLFKVLEGIEKIRKVVVVTTERERLHDPSSAFIAALSNLDRDGRLIKLVIVHDDRIDGFKAEQLQFAYNHAVANYTKGACPGHTLFFVIDADAQLEVEHITQAIELTDDSTDFFQLLQVWSPKPGADHDLRRFYLNGFCSAQNFHLLSYEIPMINEWGRIDRLRYFIGNGLIVRQRTLEFVGGFPPLIEDIRLGRIASGLGLTSRALPILFDVYAVPSVLSQWKQNATWFAASCTLVDDIAIADRLRRVEPMRKGWLLLYGFHKQARWLARGIAPLFAMSFGAVGDPILFSLGALLLTLESAIIYHIVNELRNLRKQKQSNHIEFVQIALFRLTGWVGPALGLVRVATRRLESRLSKTDR